MPNNSTFFKTIEFKKCRLQLVIYSYLINKRKLNFANKNIGILGMPYDIKKDYSIFVVLKCKNRSIFL